DVIAAAAVAGRSAETARRRVWSARLRAHKRGNTLLIERSDLDRLLKSRTGQSSLTLPGWLGSVQRCGLTSQATAEHAADLAHAATTTTLYTTWSTWPWPKPPVSTSSPQTNLCGRDWATSAGSRHPTHDARNLIEAVRIASRLGYARFLPALAKPPLARIGSR